MRLVGIDPGKHIGMSLYIDGEYREGLEATGVEELGTTLERWNPRGILMEDFRGGYAHTNQRDPLLVIGMVLMWAFERGVPVRLQSPAILRTRLPLVDGLHPNRHVRCSAAHVVHYLHKSRNQRQVRASSPG